MVVSIFKRALERELKQDTHRGTRKHAISGSVV